MKLFSHLEEYTAEAGNWVITFNGHKSSYLTLEEEMGQHDLYDFENEEMREKAIETDTVYLLQWYINTPVGFVSLAAPTLSDLEGFVIRSEVAMRSNRNES